MLHHQTSDILHVKEFLGHKKIEDILTSLRARVWISLRESRFDVLPQARVVDEKLYKNGKKLLKSCFY